MKNSYSFMAALLLAASCTLDNGITPEVHKPGADAVESIVFTARSDESVASSGAVTRVEFEYNGALHMKWEGNEVLEVYVMKNGVCDGVQKGTLYAKSSTLSQDRYSMEFAGTAEARENPETERFVVSYTGGSFSVSANGDTTVVKGKFADSNFNWTRQTLTISQDKGLYSLKHYTPITWTEIESVKPQMTKHACVIKFSASNLPANADVKSLAVVSNRGYIFPTGFDLKKSFTGTSGDGNTTVDGSGLTMVYVFTDAKTNDKGGLTVYLAAPLISGDSNNNFTVQVVCEDSNGTVYTKKAAGNVTSSTFMSSVKLYNLSRSSFEGVVNPATIIGNGSINENDPLYNTESISGQWDRFGSLTNDVYGVLDKGKASQKGDHKVIIDGLFNAFEEKNGNSDKNIHPVFAKLAGKQGETYYQGPSQSNGIQYVASLGEAQVDFNNIVLKKNTKIYLTFINTLAWNFNTIGYYCYPSSDSTKYLNRDNYSSLHKYVVLPSTSGKSNEGFTKFPAKTTVQLLYPAATGTFSEEFPSGTEIGLFSLINCMDTSKDFNLLQPGGDRYYTFTNVAWNALNGVPGRAFPENSNYINFIAASRIAKNGTLDGHSLLYGFKDKTILHSLYSAATFTNPIILIYTEKENAIEWKDGYWPKESGLYVNL